MPSKMSKIMIGFGAALLLVGLAFVPAGFGPDGDPSVMAGGMGIFSFGSLLIGLGFYLNAREVHAAIKAEKTSAVSKTGACEACEENPQVILCTTHAAGLCAACLHTHFDPRSCVFTPASRRLAKAASARG